MSKILFYILYEKPLDFDEIPKYFKNIKIIKNDENKEILLNINGVDDINVN